MTANEMHDPVMGATETVFLEYRVGFSGEVAVAKKQQFHGLAQIFVAQEKRIDPWFYVSHVDIYAVA